MGAATAGAAVGGHPEGPQAGVPAAAAPARGAGAHGPRRLPRATRGAPAGVLDSLTPITISRFYRDVEVFGAVEHEVLPALGAAAAADARDRLRAWSAGCASGEEAYTLA